jgi:pimeloyl-ACP methyl ester carboxylesterase
MLLTSNFTTINGIKLHFLEGGQGRPILIIPGWFGTAEMYRHVGEVLSQKYQTIIVDPPGFGRTAKMPLHWRFNDYQKTFTEFIKSKNLDNLILIGHSLGGAIAAAIYQDNPSITKLILADCLGIKTPNLFRYWVQNTLIKTAHKEVWIYLPEFLRNIFFPHLGSLKRSVRIIFNLDLTEQLKKITKEVILFWGEKDKLLSVKYGQAMAGIIKNSKFIIVEGATHSWPATSPERFINYIHYYVKDN